VSHLLNNALVISFHCTTCNHVSVLLKKSRKMLCLATILDLNNSLKADGQRGAVCHSWILTPAKAPVVFLS